VADRTEMNELSQSLSPELCEELSQYEKQSVIPAGAKLIQHGVVPNDLIIIQRGSVEISVPVGQRSMLLAKAGAGKVLALRPILTGTLTEIEATTLEECAFAHIPRQRFLQVLEAHPEMYFAVAKVLSADLHTAERFFREIPRTARREKMMC
jgi:CRP-like cAMP-binding protein